MLNRIIKVAPVVITLSLLATGAVAKTEPHKSQCQTAPSASLVSRESKARPNPDPECSDYYDTCDSSGACYECSTCSYGGPYCWRTN